MLLLNVPPTEDQVEAAVILFFAIAMQLAVCGCLLFALCKRKSLKFSGFALLILAALMAVKYDACLQWAYEAGLFPYLA